MQKDIWVHRPREKWPFMGTHSTRTFCKKLKKGEGILKGVCHSEKRLNVIEILHFYDGLCWRTLIRLQKTASLGRFFQPPNYDRVL